MTLKVRCQQCGKQSQFSKSDAGLTALCVACGARFTIPDADAFDAEAARATAAAGQSANDAAAESLASALPPAAESPAQVPAPVGSGETTVFATIQAAAAEESGPAPVAAVALPTPRVEPRGPGASYAILYALMGGAITAALVAAAAMVFFTRPTWEDDARVQVRDLVARAQALQLEKNYQQAYDAYRELDALIAGRDVRDDKLRADVERAQAGRDEVFKILATSSKGVRSDPAGVGVGSAKQPTTQPAVVANRADDDDEQHDWPEYKPLPINPALLGAATKPIPAVADVRPTTPAPPVSIAAAVERPAPPASTTKPAPLTSAVPDRLPRPPIRVTPRDPNDDRDARRDRAAGVTDEQIGRAIQRAVDHLIPQFTDGRLRGGQDRNDAYYTGLNALTVYALLQSSYAIRDERLNRRGPFVKRMLDEMRRMPADNGPVTYARGIRATALALADRPLDRPMWQADLKYLLESHSGGAYTYQAIPRNRMGSPGQRGKDGRWDNSNSQYGLLGVWSLAEIGAEVNSSYWAAVDQHWESCQFADGSWGYKDRASEGGRLSMTVAGVASLFVTHDYLDAPRMGAQVGREPFSKPLAKGLAYLETGDNAVRAHGGYTLYGLERVGLASGFKFFGDHDWYRELAARVVRQQNADGGWGGDVETAYHLLFLARGRHPVIMNKLRYNGHWANRPRDVANLARFGAKELERQLNWQVVPLRRDYTDWMDSPILYVSTHAELKFADDEVDKIRNFVNAGGLLFTQADGSRPEADASLRALAKRLFPAYEMKELRGDHELYNVHYKPSPVPMLWGVSNGARLLMVHTPADVTQTWQMRQEKTRRSTFELGMNLYLYAAGKTDMRNRLSSSHVPPQGKAGGGSVQVARVRYAGNWDPEPMAWERFSRLFQRATDVACDVATVDLAQLDAKATPFAHWTGTDAYTPTPAEASALARFVEAGGVLLIDPCGGGGDFHESAKLAVRRALPKGTLQLVPRDHRMMSASGPAMDDLTTPAMRTFAKSKQLGGTGRLEYLDAGKGRVLLSQNDITNGLLGANTWGVVGYDPAYAASLLKNILLWQATGMRD